ncbi:MarR family winged helix-turn-helix transcriptional regulator [Crassaminicella profunda]|uniref:MarR family winged helix-turn-helix transcriptional regulator n=1 Tax=Crassaminicella profunda TaxID=1286698 RepID=UPI001CA7AF2E|nr:MarR family transcriptional regulator [Crassaminicella profunda]QZY53702.1 MarR family transcriptional regulator [Crassaminicella profunda]
MEGELREIRKFFFKTMAKMRNYLFMDFFKRECAMHKMNKNQHKTVMILKNHGPKSMTELCSMIQLEKGSFTTVIDVLTEKGYVIRTKDEKDRRKHVIQLTKNGIYFADEQIYKLNEHLMKKLDKLSEEEMHGFLEAIKTLEKISNKL